MPLKVLVVPDKFKGTLAAAAAAEAIARGWRKGRPKDSLDLLPMSDGGDGFGEVLSALLRAKVQTIATVDAAHRPCLVQWRWEPVTKTAIIDSARVIGLAMLPPNEFHPFALDTFGLGAVLRAAAAMGARRCLMGIGGSATNDGGFGLARALGWEFLDRSGKLIERWTALGQLQEIKAPRRRRWFSNLLVAVDVQNPLLGPKGATRIYGPQKGLKAADFELAERCLGRLARMVLARQQKPATTERPGRKARNRDFSRAHGAGAAGGLGFGLAAFLGAELQPGFELFARRAGLERRLNRSDLVVSGEGTIDASTLMGKGVGQIARRCRELKIPCIGLGGAVEAGPRVRRLFAEVHALTELATVGDAKARAGFWLERLAAQVSNSWCR